jgi:hypothetical protein
MTVPYDLPFHLQPPKRIAKDSPVEQAVTKPLTHNYQAAFLYSGKIYF